MLYTIKVFYVSNKTLMLPNDKEKSVTISNNSSDAHATGARSVTRRNLTRGALWAVPAIAASTTVPAFAASADDCKTVHGPDFTQVGGWSLVALASSRTATATASLMAKASRKITSPRRRHSPRFSMSTAHPRA